MTSLIDIQSQIKMLQKQESEIKSKDFDQTRMDILEKMEAFGITLKDLQGALPRGSKPGRIPYGATGDTVGMRKSAGLGKKSRAGIPVAAKYRGPEGQTWTGRGLMPRWLVALTSDGKIKADFEIKNQSNDSGAKHHGKNDSGSDHNHDSEV